MLALLWLVPAFPFAGFATLALVGRRLSRPSVAAIGIAAVALSTVLGIAIAVAFLASSPATDAYSQLVWRWFDVAGFSATVSFYLDAISLVMMLVVTVVSLLIHLYSAEFMSDDRDYSRFFAYMNLFVGMMLTLTLADNLPLLLLGWEGVGLCSYLLIGFWYRDPANGRAARKAFIVTRVGDTAFLVGIFLLFSNLGSVQIQELMARAASAWGVNSGLAVAAAALLLGGALGKSAQLPLQTWLPDAMAGPTPVSALIHAATMVTAGVYLVARTHVLFALAPAVLSIVAVVGAATLLYAACAALAQSDIKRTLAYSTISQVGYMFLALGVGAWSSAIFHLVTHAFFKALLFLSAGVVILALNHEQNMFRMGGLRRQLPLAFWTFLAGAASLAALPLVTAGFYSKDLILSSVWSSPTGGPWLWTAGMAGALLTAIYSFRMVFLVFFGAERQATHFHTGNLIRLPLLALAFLALTAGFIELPRMSGGMPLFSGLLGRALPDSAQRTGAAGAEAALALGSMAATFAGIYIAYVLFLRHRAFQRSIEQKPLAAAVRRFLLAGWGFDWLYDRLIVRPFVWLAGRNQCDVLDLIYQDFSRLIVYLSRLLSGTESGRARSYAVGIAIGAAVLLAIGILS